jgi:nucleoid DNA-binding protein
MTELLDKLVAEAGLTEEQAKKAIETIKSFVVEKFPMLEGAVQNIFGKG